MDNPNFSNWLQIEMNKRGWSNADLAKKSGISPTQVGRILSETRNVGIEGCQAIAKALNTTPMIVFQAAGYLPKEIEIDPEYEEIKHIIKGLPPEYKEDILEYARLKARLAEQRGEYAAQRTVGKTP